MAEGRGVHIMQRESEGMSLECSTGYNGPRSRSEESEARGPVRLEQSQVKPREGGGRRPSTHVTLRRSEGMSAVQDTTAREAEAKGARLKGQADLSIVKSHPERAEASGRAHTSCNA